MSSVLLLFSSFSFPFPSLLALPFRRPSLASQKVAGILNISCPNAGCGKVFADFTGCFALSCDVEGNAYGAVGCGTHFCAFCLKVFADSDACHKHVLVCSQGVGHYFYGDQETAFNRAHQQRREREVAAYLQTLQEPLLARVREGIAGLLRELGMQPL